VPGVSGRKGQKVGMQIIAAIIEPRCEEIFTMVKKAVYHDEYYRMLGGGIVLTGGSACIRGMEGVAEQVFDLPVRMGRPKGLEGLVEIVCDEGWSVGVGLLMYGRDNIVGSVRGGKERLRWMIDGLRRIASLF